MAAHRNLKALLIVVTVIVSNISHQAECCTSAAFGIGNCSSQTMSGTPVSGNGSQVSSPQSDAHNGSQVSSPQSGAHNGSQVSSPQSDPHNGSQVSSPQSGAHNGSQVSSPQSDPHNGSQVSSPQSDADGGISYSQLAFVLVGIYQPTVFTIGLFGNGLSLVILTKGVLKSSSSVYLFGIALIDFIYQVCSFPYTFSAYSFINTMLSWKTFSSYYVSYVVPITGTCFTASVWIIVAFTIERLIVVVYPIKIHLVSERRSKAIVCIVIVLAVLLNAPRFFDRRPYMKVDPGTNTSYIAFELTPLRLSVVYTTTMFWLSFLLTMALPFLSLLVCNSLIAFHIRAASRKAHDMVSKPAGQSNVTRLSRDSQITRLLFGVVIAFFLCNSIVAAVSLFVAINGATMNFQSWFRKLIMFGNVFASTNSCLDFILYATCSSEMRRAMKDMLSCWCRRKTGSGNSSSQEGTQITGVV